MKEHSRLRSGGNGVVWAGEGMTSVEARSTLIWLPPKKLLKASREREWESEAKVDYGGLDSHAKEFEHCYVHSGKGSKQRWVGENDVQRIENLMHLQCQG